MTEPSIRWAGPRHERSPLPTVIRAALKASHPDNGGDASEFVRVQAARKALRE